VAAAAVRLFAWAVALLVVTPKGRVEALPEFAGTV